MRKIEAQMIMAVRDQLNGTSTKEWRSANTCVRSVYDAQLGPTVVVELHGNEIAQFANDGSLKITDAGWQTVTTKSRLNALLSCFYGGGGICQVKGVWLLNSTEFSGTDWVSYQWQDNWQCQQAELVTKPAVKASGNVYDVEWHRATSEALAVAKGLAAATCLA
jgi:hypothetical protein